MKNIDHVYYEASKRLNLPYDVIQKVYSHYYKNSFYNKVMAGEGTSFFLSNLGTFRFSYIKVICRALEVIRRIKKWRDSDQYTEERRLEILEDYYNELWFLLKIRKQLSIESQKYFNGTVSRLLKSPTRGNKKSG